MASLSPHLSSLHAFSPNPHPLLTKEEPLAWPINSKPDFTPFLDGNSMVRPVESTGQCPDSSNPASVGCRELFKAYTGRDLPEILLKHHSTSADENVITVVDAMGREFVTNLRLGDLKNMMKQSFFARSTGDTDNVQPIRQAKRTTSKGPAPYLQQLMRRTDSNSILKSALEIDQDNASLDEDFARKVLNSCRVNPLKAPRKTSPSMLLRQLREDEAKLNSMELPRLPESMSPPIKYSDSHTRRIAALNGIGPPLTVPPTVSRPKVSPSPPQPLKPVHVPDADYRPGKQYISKPPTGSREPRRCRGVYGIINQHLWCNMCRWKKRCRRFTMDPTTSSEN